MMHTDINQVSRTIIGAAIDVHRTLGPGLLESAYEQCLAHEFGLRHIPFEQQKPLPVDYTRSATGLRISVGLSGSGNRRRGGESQRSSTPHPSGSTAQLFETWWMEARIAH